MKALAFAALFAPTFAHAGSEACFDMARSMVQYEYDNAVRYAQTQWADPEDRKFAACVGQTLGYDGAVRFDSGGYEYFRYSFSVNCGGGVVWSRSQELYTTPRCEIRGE